MDKISSLELKMTALNYATKCNSNSETLLAEAQTIYDWFLEEVDWEEGDGSNKVTHLTPVN